VAEFDWERTVFALISPDALARHLGVAVLERIESAGFALVAWRVLWHRPADLDSFHEHSITHAWEAYQYRLVDQLFAFGPAVALVAGERRGARPPSAGQSSHQRLLQAKGSSQPHQSGPGTIRGDLGSINAVLSLMHSADSPAHSARESAVFAAGDGFTSSDPAELRTVLSLLQASTRREDRGYREVLAGLRARALAAAWDELPRPLRKTAGAMLDAGADSFATPDGGEGLAALLPEAHPLTGLLRADFTPRSPGPDPERVKLVLAIFGTGLDEWESLVLATSRRFWPRGTKPG
jgi:nucleoside diphosphate kinase